MNQFYRLIFLIVSYCILFYGCNSQNEEINHLLKEWYRKKISFTPNLQIENLHKNTIYNWTSSKYKIVNYIDSSGCFPCKLKLPLWKQFKKTTDSLKINVSYIFISQTEHYYDLAVQQQRNYFIMPYYYDKNGIMKKENSIFKNPLGQTLLLDSINQIILIGNPINNQNIRQLYIQKMQK